MKRIESGFIFDREEAIACEVNVGVVSDATAMDVNMDIIESIEAQHRRLDELEGALPNGGEGADYTEIQMRAKRVLQAEGVHAHFMDLICENSDIGVRVERLINEGW